MANNQKPSENPNEFILPGDFFPQEQSIPIKTEEDSEDQPSEKRKGRLREELEDRGKEKIKKYAKEKLGIEEKKEGRVEKPLSDGTKPLSQSNKELTNVGENLSVKTTEKEVLEESAKNIAAKQGVEKVGGQVAKQGVEKVGGQVAKEGVEKVGGQVAKQGGKLAAQLGAKIATTAGSAAAESSTGVGAVVAVVQVAAAIGDIAVMPLQQLAKGEYSKIDESEMVLWGLFSLFMSFFSIFGAFFFLGIFNWWLARSKGSDKSFGITRFLVQALIGSIPIFGLPFCVLGWSIPQHNKTNIGIGSSKKSGDQKKPEKSKVPKK